MAEDGYVTFGWVQKKTFGKRGGGDKTLPIPGRLRLPVTWDKHYSVDTGGLGLLQMALVPVLGPLDLVSGPQLESSLLSL